MPAALTDIQSDEYMRYAENCVKMAKVALNNYRLASVGLSEWL